MKRRLVTVEAARAGEFLQALTALGLEAREVDRLMPVPIILLVSPEGAQVRTRRG